MKKESIDQIKDNTKAMALEMQYYDSTNHNLHLYLSKIYICDICILHPLYFDNHSHLHFTLKILVLRDNPLT